MKVNGLNKNLWKNYLEVLGVIGILTSFITIFVTIKDDYKLTSGIVFAVILVLLFLYLWCRANNTNKIELKINGLSVNVFYGDIFKPEGLKLIAFNEYFDTEVDNVLIANNSLNGKFINQNYTELESLDNQISSALQGIPFTINPERTLGKKNRYELGTTIEIENNYLLSVFTRFDNRNQAFLNKGEYLLCLMNLWREINRVYAQRNINIPLLGSGISRIGNELKPQNYLEQILNTLQLSNLDFAHNSKLNIVLHESVREHINLFEIKNRKYGK